MQIEELITRVDEELAKDGSYPFLADIRNSLQQLRDTDAESEKERSEMASGLGRLILEVFSFSESPLGKELLDFSDSYVKDGLP